VYFLNIKGLKIGEKPHFERSTYENDELIEIDPVTYVDGVLTKVAKDGVEIEGVWKPKFKLFLADEKTKELVIVESFYTTIGRSILNSLASCERYGKIILSLSLYRPKKEGQIGKEYPSVYVANDDQHCPWKYSYDSYKDLIVIINKPGGETERNFYNLNQWFEQKVLTEIEDRLKTQPLVPELSPELPVEPDIDEVEKDIPPTVQSNTPVPGVRGRPLKDETLGSDDLPF
jgi:hypothetical protein